MAKVIFVFVYNLDSKNRVSMPVSARRGLFASRNVLVVRNLVIPVVSVYPANPTQELLDEITAYAFGANRQEIGKHDFRVLLDANSHERRLDTRGRVFLTPEYVEHAHLESHVSAVATPWCVDLWDPAQYETYLDRVYEELGSARREKQSRFPMELIDRTKGPETL